MEKLFGGTPIELKPGMVLRYDKRDCDGAAIVDGYMLYLRSSSDGFLEGYDLEMRDGGRAVALFRASLNVRESAVSAVYGWEDGQMFPAYELAYIVSPDPGGMNQAFRRLVTVWERHEPVHEMTVDEISKALGYKLKVVGSK